MMLLEWFGLPFYFSLCILGNILCFYVVCRILLRFFHFNNAKPSAAWIQIWPGGYEIFPC